MIEEKILGFCCERPNCNGFIKSIGFLDGTCLEFCTECDYIKLRSTGVEIIEGKMYHKHYPSRFWNKHLVSTKHKPKEDEFQSFEEWKKTNPRFKDIKLEVPKPIIESATQNNKTPIEELLDTISPSS
jgi:hypothetical protein